MNDMIEPVNSKNARWSLSDRESADRAL